jgi:hypothetical protein
MEATCQWCGGVEVAVSDVRCEIATGAGEGLCEFTCPQCSRLVLRRVPARGVAALRSVGARPLAGAVPFELLESHPARSLSWDDVLDVSIALRQGCCPQEELIGAGL